MNVFPSFTYSPVATRVGLGAVGVQFQAPPRFPPGLFITKRFAGEYRRLSAAAKATWKKAKREIGTAPGNTEDVELERKTARDRALSRLVRLKVAEAEVAEDGWFNTDIARFSKRKFLDVFPPTALMDYTITGPAPPRRYKKLPRPTRPMDVYDNIKYAKPMVLSPTVGTGPAGAFNTGPASGLDLLVLAIDQTGSYREPLSEPSSPQLCTSEEADCDEYFGTPIAENPAGLFSPFIDVPESVLGASDDEDGSDDGMDEDSLFGDYSDAMDTEDEGTVAGDDTMVWEISHLGARAWGSQSTLVDEVDDYKMDVEDTTSDDDHMDIDRSLVDEDIDMADVAAHSKFNLKKVLKRILKPATKVPAVDRMAAKSFKPYNSERSYSRRLKDWLSAI